VILYSITQRLSTVTSSYMMISYILLSALLGVLYSSAQVEAHGIASVLVISNTLWVSVCHKRIFSRRTLAM
jgi:hypothetical protein